MVLQQRPFLGKPPHSFTNYAGEKTDTSTTMYILRPLMAFWLKRVLVICELLRLLVHVVVAHMHLVVGDLGGVHRVLVHTEPH